MFPDRFHLSHLDPWDQGTSDREVTREYTMHNITPRPVFISDTKEIPLTSYVPVGKFS